MKKSVLITAAFALCFSFASFAQNAAEELYEEKSSEYLSKASTVQHYADAQLAMSVSNYPVTCGDVYSLYYAAGTTPVSYSIPVDTSYKIRVANLGVINAAGLTYQQLKSQVETLVLRNYPMGGVQFVLSSPATFIVTVKGEVNKTVEKDAWALSRLSSVIAGCTTSYSSTRSVTVISSSGKKNNYDLFKAVREGDLSQDPFMRPGDTVVVNRLDRRVSITGQVERPGTYELVAGENLKTLIEYYGHGLTTFANTEKIALQRIVNGSTKSGEKLYLDATAITNDYELNNGDTIEITSLSSLMPTIVVEGIISNPKQQASNADTAENKNAPLDTSYKAYIRFYTGENYATLIRRISGMFNSYSDLKNAYIDRNGQKLPLDIEHILYDAELMSDKNVMPNDRLVIPFQQHLEKVFVVGEVTSAVEITAWPLKRLSDIVSGHLTSYSSTRNITVKSVDGVETTYDLFKASRFGDLSQNPYIRSGETVTVSRISRKVTIAGEVERPGTYQLLENENLTSLIMYYSNGFAPLADATRVEITRAASETAKAGEKIYVNYEELVKNNVDFDLQCYDSVKIYSYNNLKPVMFMEGAIGQDGSGTELLSTNRASVGFTEGENYAYLVRNHAGWFKSVSDTEHAYLVRQGQVIPMNLNLMLHDATYYSEYTVEPLDTLVVPFRQFFVTVAGAVRTPGRFPYIPDRTYEYYVGLAGGFDITKNKFGAVDISTIDGTERSKNDIIQPEDTITAETNSTIYYFNQYAPVVTSILSIVATTVSILVASGLLTK